MIVEKQPSGAVTFQLVASLLDALDRPLLVSDRSGQVLFANLHAQDALAVRNLTQPESSIFSAICCASIERKLSANWKLGSKKSIFHWITPRGNSAHGFAGYRSPIGWRCLSSHQHRKHRLTKRKCDRLYKS